MESHKRGDKGLIFFLFQLLYKRGLRDVITRKNKKTTVETSLALDNKVTDVEIGKIYSE
jgi:hypothetical protein